MTFVHRLRFNNKKEDTFTPGKSVTRSELFRSANRFSSKQCSASTLPTDSCPTDPMRQLLVYEHSRVLEYVRIRTFQICHRAVPGCTLLASLLLLPWRSIHRAKCSVLHPSRCSQPIPTVVCLCSLLVHIRRRRDSVGSMVSRIPILQICNAVVVLQEETGFVPTSAQIFAVGTFLILRSPSCTRSCTQKYHVSLCFVLGPAPLPIRQRIRRRTVTLDINFHSSS